MNMLPRILFRSLLFLVIVLITMALVVTWYKGYQGSIESILSFINTRKNSRDLSALITERRFRYIQFLLLVLIFFMVGLMFTFNILFRIFSELLFLLY